MDITRKQKIEVSGAELFDAIDKERKRQGISVSEFCSRTKGLGRSYWYQWKSGVLSSLTFGLVRNICATLGKVPHDFGVVTPVFGQPLRSVEDAPVGEPVLGAYWDLGEQRYMFVDVTLNQIGQWINVNGDVMDAPDGWVGLPSIEGEDK